MARQLGAKNPWEGYSPYGGFDLGSPPPVQSSVSTPNPAVAGVSGGPAGGMSVGQPTSQPEDGGGASPSTDAGNANVTGFNSALASNGMTFAGLPAGVGGIATNAGALGGQLGGMLGGLTGSPVGAVAGSQVGGLVGSAAQNAALGAVPGGMVSQGSPATPDSSAIPAGSPVTYGGQIGESANFSSIPGLLSGLGQFASGQVGIPTGSLVANVPSGVPSEGNIPSQGLSVQVPSVSPNVGAYAGTGTPGSTFSGLAGDANGGRMAGIAPTGSFGVPAPSPAPGIFSSPFGRGRGGDDPTEGEVTNTNTAVPANFSDPVDLGLPEGNTPGVVGDAPGTVGDTSGTPGSGLGTPGDTGGGDAPGPPGTVGDTSGTPGSGLGDPGDGGGAGGTSGGGGSGSGMGGDGSGFKKGGKIRRPDPKKLSAKLQQGAKVTAGDPDSRTDDVRNVNLQHGEFVIDRDSTKMFESLLQQLNAIEPNQLARTGGMSVGRR